LLRDHFVYFNWQVHIDIWPITYFSFALQKHNLTLKIFTAWLIKPTILFIFSLKYICKRDEQIQNQSLKKLFPKLHMYIQFQPKNVWMYPCPCCFKYNCLPVLLIFRITWEKS
jgi:hypothetical protein